MNHFPKSLIAMFLAMTICASISCVQTLANTHVAEKPEVIPVVALQEPQIENLVDNIIIIESEETTAAETETEESETVIETTTIAETEQPKYTEEDVQYLTMVLVGECQGYSWEHQVAVGSVVLNRVASPSYPDTIKGVCLQKGQYSCFRDGNAYRTPTSRNVEVAMYLLENGSQYPSNCVFQSQSRQGSGVYKKIGNTYICYR